MPSRAQLLSVIWLWISITSPVLPLAPSTSGGRPEQWGIITRGATGYLRCLLKSSIPSSSHLGIYRAESLVPIGNDVMAIRYYSMATQVLYYYDCLLTLPDEIRYAWSGRKTWISVVFILNRYSPALYQAWVFFVGFLPQFTHHTCNKTAFLQILSFFLCTLFAQVSLILRLYALTLKNKPVVTFFSAFSLAQFLMGMYMVGVTARKPAQTLPEIPLQAYNLCVFTRSPRFELAYMALSMTFDALTISVIVFVSIKSGIPLPGGQPSILRTIVEDSTVYFLVIFSSHLVSLVVLLTTRPSLQLLPALGNLVLMPLMISRLMLSLKKASRDRKGGWTSGALSGAQVRTCTQLDFASPSNCPEDSGVSTASEEVALSDLSHLQAKRDNKVEGDV